MTSAERSFGRAFACAVLALQLVQSACGGSGLTDREERAVTDWLTCIECTSGERVFLRDSVGPEVVPLLREILFDFPQRYIDDMDASLGAEWAAVPGRDVDSASFVSLSLDNFIASAQRRAAQALGDRQEATILSDAMSQAALIGFRPDVFDELERSLARAQVGAIGPDPDSIAILPSSIPDLEVSQVAVVVAYVFDADGKRIPNPVTWNTTPAGVVQLVVDGPQRARLTGQAPNNATVTATTANGLSDQIPVGVVLGSNLVLEKRDGDQQRTAINTEFTRDFVARVLSGGAGSQGQTVTWEIVAGSATFSVGGSQTTDVTNANGDSSVRVTAGPTPGPVQVKATVGRAPPVFFNVNVTG